MFTRIPDILDRRALLAGRRAPESWQAISHSGHQIESRPAQVEKAQWIEQFRTSECRTCHREADRRIPRVTKRPPASAELNTLMPVARREE